MNEDFDLNGNNIQILKSYGIPHKKKEKWVYGDLYIFYKVIYPSKEELYDDLINIYPDLKSSAHAKDSVISREIVRNGMSAIANHLNINAIEKIEIHNQKKNSLVEICYWFNPLSFFQNKWNSYTSTDYMSYKQYRDDIQQLIDNRLELLVLGTWNKEVLETESYNKYLEKLK